MEGWVKSVYIPAWDTWKHGLLDWENSINPLASGVKCAWRVTTVSPSYMNELTSNSNGLEKLFEIEKGKCVGILNGIDVEVWNPEKDSFIEHHFNAATVNIGKQKCKMQLCQKFGLNATIPLIIFIGRLVGEKAADVLPKTIQVAMQQLYGKFSILILGSGDPIVEKELSIMNNWFNNNYACEIGYNESLSHLMYAGADFLLMPSRVEPCGLNQMYALAYGTVPMVRKTGGLQDTVNDMGNWEGFGITFNNASVDDMVHGIARAIEVYKDQDAMNNIRNIMMQIDHSWESVIDEYDKIYNS